MKYLAFVMFMVFSVCSFTTGFHQIMDVTGRRYQVELDVNFTVLKLKEIIGKEMGIPVEKLSRFVVTGEIQVTFEEDKRTLKSYGITDENISELGLMVFSMN